MELTISMKINCWQLKIKKSFENFTNFIQKLDLCIDLHLLHLQIETLKIELNRFVL